MTGNFFVATTNRQQSIVNANAEAAAFNARATEHEHFPDFERFNQKFHVNTSPKILRANGFADRRIVGNVAFARDEKFCNRAVRADKSVSAFDNVDFAVFKLDLVRRNIFDAKTGLVVDLSRLRRRKHRRRRPGSAASLRPGEIRSVFSFAFDPFLFY